MAVRHRDWADASPSPSHGAARRILEPCAGGRCRTPQGTIPPVPPCQPRVANEFRGTWRLCRGASRLADWPCRRAPHPLVCSPDVRGWGGNPAAMEAPGRRGCAHPPEGVESHPLDVVGTTEGQSVPEDRLADRRPPLVWPAGHPGHLVGAAQGLHVPEPLRGRRRRDRPRAWRAGHGRPCGHHCRPPTCESKRPTQQAVRNVCPCSLSFHIFC